MGTIVRTLCLNSPSAWVSICCLLAWFCPVTHEHRLPPSTPPPPSTLASSLSLSQTRVGLGVHSFGVSSFDSCTFWPPPLPSSRCRRSQTSTLPLSRLVELGFGSGVVERQKWRGEMRGSGV